MRPQPNQQAQKFYISSILFNELKKKKKKDAKANGLAMLAHFIITNRMPEADKL